MSMVSPHDMPVRNLVSSNLRVEMAWDVAEEGETDVDNEISEAATDHEDADRRAWQTRQNVILVI